MRFRRMARSETVNTCKAVELLNARQRITPTVRSGYSTVLAFWLGWPTSEAEWRLRAGRICAAAAEAISVRSGTGLNGSAGPRRFSYRGATTLDRCSKRASTGTASGPTTLRNFRYPAHGTSGAGPPAAYRHGTPVLRRDDEHACYGPWAGQPGRHLAPPDRHATPRQRSAAPGYWGGAPAGVSVDGFIWLRGWVCVSLELPGVAAPHLARPYDVKRALAWVKTPPTAGIRIRCHQRRFGRRPSVRPGRVNSTTMIRSGSNRSTPRWRQRFRYTALRLVYDRCAGASGNSCRLLKRSW